jgi:ABC-2 type transport system ATP-binding protein
VEMSPIQVDDLFVSYRSRKGVVDAVRGLTFSVEEGEIVGFLGPNGAGKSSTLKALMGFVPPKSGTSRIFGELAGSVESRRQVGYLPEVALYYSYLTPLETLTLYGELQGLGGRSLRKQIEEVLTSLNIAEAMRKQNRTLSKGMLQRVGIAQSLLGAPKLLVLDEVTSGLDPVGRQELRAILKSRQEQGTTLFFSSHELAEVDLLCDRILLVNKGRMIEERRMSDLKEQLRSFKLSYRGAANLAGVNESLIEQESGIHEATYATKPELLSAIQRVTDAKGEVVDVATLDGSLEDYFIATVGDDK